MEAAEFLRRLRERLEPSVLAAVDGCAELGETVASDLAVVAERWPQQQLTPQFVDHVAAHLAGRDDLAKALPRLRIADLYLAWWSGSGDPDGIAAFESTFGEDLAALERRFHRLPRDEARQELRIKLFVSGDRPPRIREYSGFGFLRNWLRVTAVRSFVDIARRQPSRDRERALDDDLLAGLADSAPDPRLAQIRDQLSTGAKRAFKAAVTGLAPRQRNFLRHAHVDGLTLNQIAALYSVHRATVARTLARARQQLLDDTRSYLAADLGVAESDLESVIRALDTGLELSLSRVLRTDVNALGTPK